MTMTMTMTMMILGGGGGPCCNDDWCWQWHGKSRLQWPQPNDWWNRHIFRQSIHNQHFLCLVLGDFSMPMCTAIGWPVPCLQRVLFADNWVFKNLLCSCLHVVMPERIKSALKIKSEKESRNVFTHLQCHDSGTNFQRCIMFRFLSQIDHIGLYKALVILGDFLPVRILWQPTFSYRDKSC